VTYQNLRTRYTGEVAQNYEERRRRESKWALEDDALKGLLSTLAERRESSLILDSPIGTGRFLPLYAELHASVIGVDVSEDMLVQASDRAQELRMGGATFLQGDAMRLPVRSDTIDIAVCIRFLNWIPIESVRQVLMELDRVTRGAMIVGVRVAYPLWRLRLSVGLRRLKSYAVSALPGRVRTTKHRASDVNSLFFSLGLSITARRLVDVGADGSEYSLYLLSGPDG
jgi:SAM-dependent methyltransferase